MQNLRAPESEQSLRVQRIVFVSVCVAAALHLGGLCAMWGFVCKARWVHVPSGYQLVNRTA